MIETVAVRQLPLVKKPAVRIGLIGVTVNDQCQRLSLAHDVSGLINM